MPAPAKNWRTGLPVSLAKLVFCLPWFLRGFLRSRRIRQQFPLTSPRPESDNPLQEFFLSTSKKGIWKWMQYVDIYHRHFARFVGKEVHVLEIGVLGGGSLQMWKSYFGPRCHVYGVDIDPRCKKFEEDRVTIFIGDQADPRFWDETLARIPALNIIIDDGGHRTRQQVVTFEKTLPRLRPGGVYVCEDTHGAPNGFAAYVHGLAHNFNAFHRLPGEELAATTTPLQETIASMHLYPFVTVVEMHAYATGGFVATKKADAVREAFVAVGSK